MEVTVDTGKLADKTDGFSGAELEYLINNTAWDIISSSKIEGKVTIGISNFIQVIKNLNKQKSHEPKSKQVNVDLESLNNPIDNVKSHSSANSNSNVVETEVIQQNVLSTMQAKINELEKKFEELDCNNSDLEQVLKNVKQDIECAKESTQLKGDLKAITEKSSQLQSKLESIEQDLTKITQCAEEHTQLQSELESMVTTELKKHESTLENRVENL